MGALHPGSRRLSDVPDSAAIAVVVLIYSHSIAHMIQLIHTEKDSLLNRSDNDCFN
jgi:hypothetical protein